MNKLHQPVLLAEVIQALDIKTGRWYIDATFGRGGHSENILSQGGKVIAFDVDKAAIEFAKQNFASEIADKKLILVRENFDKLAESVSRIKRRFNIDKIYGILFDFGASTDQLKDEARGFSFDSDTLLDMRMDDRLGVTAADLINMLSDRELTKLFWEYGGEEVARRIARAIIFKRKQGQQISTTKQLADLICQVKKRNGKLHPATKAFQALRIAVNSELDNIKAALPQAFELLESSGKLVTITFHEGEDALVKHFLKTQAEARKCELITKKPLTASETEISKNPNSRSAKLRIAKKI